ncbi:AbrB/MazE/SpoVT family DNA-binding domain-containing protein [Calderihabitans maritimus]|uniref:AbrB family transcriptional regulator n=1 Tax=Calderihabitans maritimus TaxID=1246530 RepID=A0A1Z5HXT8_9FIRM|nr:AbrB/MazE/SpoVT family DNA-binding domain-containing protein [Calderihabitans maritimus]GAW94100.1 AbrB family transcriptional regulator [Calderihabitans maritimus]
MERVGRIKLKVSPKGQITIPKTVRKKLSIGNYVYLKVDEERSTAILEPVSLIDEMEELIIREVEQEGYSGREAKVRVKQKKKMLLRALEQELKERMADEDVPEEEVLRELGLNHV